MSTLSLSLRYLLSRPLAAVLNLLLLTLGVASVGFVLLVGEQVDRAFERDLAGIDLVVGAKGSPIQLILSGVFHLDVPPGNVPLADVQALARHPMVGQVIPLSIGDSFRGFRIVGTEPAYLDLYRLRVAGGAGGEAAFAPMQALLGHAVAQATGLAPGQRFIGQHGLSGGHAHGDTPYTVAGVLAPCHCVADRLVLTALESVWRVHEDATAADAEDRRLLQAEREVTMALVRYRTPLAAVTVPRWVNGSTPMQAAAPAVEVTRLLQLLGVGTRVLHGFGLVLLASAALSVFIALWNAVRERRADLAMLRLLGARPMRVAALVLCQSLWLAVAACALGLLAAHGAAALVASLLADGRSLPVTAWVWVPQEAWVVAGALGLALLAALIPAASAYRTDVAQLLQSNP
ncbi:ABC transporter permease [Ramlibacter rhizophilus]|uniref:FtsX-like permease family protein n=1 Tax=Ramlibacter rhizophilus TaxID=1781167 RepID=A0A4Z0BBM5_9BURK|nr:ABC transporter permease [Ramlibacter rhizophilus]TFY96555.1 FtsX-like permease family protein [Ramlibacter rhizophilus]